MVDDYLNRLFTRPLRQVLHVGQSLRMVAGLPSARESLSDDLLSNACLESWLVNVRLMAEFLLIVEGRENRRRDFSASDFGWDGETSIETSNVKQMWLVASKHLVHFSKDRTPEDANTLDPTDVTFEGLRNVSETVLQVMEAFVSCLEVIGHTEASSFRIQLNSALLIHSPTT